MLNSCRSLYLPQFGFICVALALCCGSPMKPESQLVKNSIEVTEGVIELDLQIWKIFQDKQGRYWFGSNGSGVYLYNGAELKQYTKKDGLIDDAIRGIQGDKDGNIYVETPSGVSKYDGSQFVTLEVANDKEAEWRLDSNDLWFNCNSNALYRYDGQFLHELQLPEQDLGSNGMDPGGVSFSGMNNSPYAVYGVNRDLEGNMWFGTITAGAFRYDGDSFLWFGETELTTLPDGRVPGIRSILQDKNGYYWLSNFISKYRINPDASKGYDKLTAEDLYKDSFGDKLLYFNSGLVDRNGDLWMTTYGGGVWYYDGEELTNFEVHNGKEDVLLVSIYEDKKGVLWLGTNNDGVYKKSGDAFVKFIL